MPIFSVQADRQWLMLVDELKRYGDYWHSRPRLETKVRTPEGWFFKTVLKGIDYIIEYLPHHIAANCFVKNKTKKVGSTENKVLFLEAMFCDTTSVTHQKKSPSYVLSLKILQSLPIFLLKRNSGHTLAIAAVASVGQYKTGEVSLQKSACFLRQEYEARCPVYAA